MDKPAPSHTVLPKAVKEDLRRKMEIKLRWNAQKQILLKVLATKAVPSDKIQRWYQVIGQVIDELVTYDTYVTVYKCEDDRPKLEKAELRFHQLEKRVQSFPNKKTKQGSSL